MQQAPATPDMDPAAEAPAPRVHTLLLTDLCDSVALVERLGDTAAAELFQEHDRLVLRLQQQWKGRMIDRSDGLLLLFERPVNGLGFALDYRQGLEQLGKLRGIDLQARTGMHVGEVLTWHNSVEAVQAGAKPLEVEGLAKPLAARLMALARPGQILLSAVAESLAHRSARELGARSGHLLWKSHGRWHFKGVPTTQEVFEVGEPGFAPLRTPRSTPKAWRDLPFWRRPMALVAEAALLAALCVGAWFFMRPEPAIAFAERDWVVLADVVNGTDETIFDASVRRAIMLGLDQSRHVNVLSDGKVRESLEMARKPANAILDRGLAVDIAVREGARAVLLPTITREGTGYRIAVSLVAPGTDATVRTYHAVASGTDKITVAVDDVVKQLREGLGESVAELRKSLPLSQASTSSLRALRSFALAETAIGLRRFEEARNLYQAAVEIDPEFALAYAGLAKLHARTGDMQPAREQLQRALAFTSQLPHRERLYLKAWQAELEPDGWPLEDWRALARLYPDSFAGLSNTSWYLFQDNRFGEAEAYARAASVPQDYLRVYPMVQLGQIQIALNQPETALQTLRQAHELQGGSSAGDAQIDALVAMRRYAEAEQMLAGIDHGGESLQGLMGLRARLLVAADQGDCPAMKAALRADPAKPAVAYQRIHQRLQHVVAGVVCGDGGELGLSAVAAELSPLLRRTDDPAWRDHSLQMLALVYLAQRQQQTALSSRLLRENGEVFQSQRSPVVAKWYRLVQAMEHLQEGRADAAVAAVQPMLDGSEPLQAHVLLLNAHRRLGDTAAAEREQQWLAGNRGRAIAELMAMQVLQPLNVHDVAAATAAAPVASAAAG
ncbi:putative peptide modification system cyclase [Stenotrophomonas acidaminiphila]|uniref:putative peptide modification system cyclase n=1 Tax=Stenotrophomonas acidaminiphila TaxID=128780 RepID=UPI00289F9323|nr:putative peptide modification system cyclase [Stenotrophomonas acidaminiphila]